MCADQLQREHRMTVGIKERALLSATEVVELHRFLDRKLDVIGLSSQPEVAVRLLELSNQPNSALADYAKIIRTDHALAGRVLRLANSAFFAQRRPVTAIDRACVVLGIERLKAVSLGFQLSRAAQPNTDLEYSRQIWGQSLFRACLATHLAKLTAPTLTSEAFVVGLMIDAGLPLMPRLLGDQFRTLRDTAGSPSKLAKAETDSLPYTHVDVITCLCTKWKLPDLLVRPMEWHHTKPPEIKREDPVSRLHRIAYVVGLIELTQPNGSATVAPPTNATPGVMVAQRILSLSDSELNDTVRGSVNEYHATTEMFNDIANGIPNLDAMMELVQLRLNRAVDNVVEHDLVQEAAVKPTKLSLGGHTIELVREPDGNVMAYLYDSHGNRLLAHRFVPTIARPTDICDALGIDHLGPVDLERLQQTLLRMAA